MKELRALEEVDRMCKDTLTEKQYDNWEGVMKVLREKRKKLKQSKK